MSEALLNRNPLFPALVLLLFGLIGCTSSNSSFSTNVAGPALSFSVTTQGQTVDIDTFSFGSSGSSANQILELWNHGDWKALIVDISLNPPYSFTGGSFPGTGGTCGREIEAKSSCKLSITYSPGGESNALGSFAITYIGSNYRKTLTVHFSVQSGGLADSGGDPTPPLPAPQLHPTTPILPNAGPLAGGNVIVLLGSGFQSGSTVTVGGAACGPVTFLNSTSVSCPIPPHLSGPGSVDVTLLNPDGQTVTLANAYTYNAAPTLGGLAPGSPTSSALAGGTLISLQGTGFLAGATLTIGGTPCTSLTIVSPTLLNCLTPAHGVGNFNVVFTNPDGQSATLGSTLRYNAFPTLAGSPISPVAGPLAGGTPLTISGTGFLPGADVEIGGTDCLNIVVVSSTIITCNSPAHAAGTYNLLVRNTDTQSVSLSNAFTYNIAPSFGAIPVTPASGPLAGGTTIMISGSGFLPGASVTIGGLPCNNTVVLTSSTISCDTPAHLTGSYPVVVTNLDLQTNTLLNGFTYIAAPSLAGANPVSPASGPVAGGTAITISGSGFINGATVTIGGSPCLNVTFISSSLLGCTTPAGSSGGATVVVTNPDLQNVVLAAGFTYNPAPAFGPGSPVSPASGPAAGGTLITISGSGFQNGASVSIANIACSSVVFNSASSLSCVTPGGSAGVADIKITNPDGQFVILANGFTYNAPPTLSAVAPIQGPESGGTAVTLTGANFVVGATVTIGGTACLNPVVTAATTLTCTTDAHAAGAVSVAITNPDGQIFTLGGGFTYIAAPTVSSVVRSAGALAGGTAVTVNGTGFISGATVDFGGVACANPVVVTANTITCTTGAHSAGAVSVTVTNPDLQTGVLAAAYVYQPAPTVVSLNPVSGPSSGGTYVTITGTGFVPGATVLFGGVEASSVNVMSDTLLSANTPAYPGSGLVTVRVTNADTQFGEKANAFDYQYVFVCGNPAPAQAPFAGGNGQAATPYLIANANQLDKLRNCTSHNFLLTADIDLDQIAFEPISSFDGTLDGGGHSILNWTYVGGAQYGPVGFIRWLSTGTIRNLALENIDLTSNDGYYVGGLVGSSWGTPRVDQVTVSGTIRVTQSFFWAVGAIVGYYGGYQVAQCSYNSTTVGLFISRSSSTANLIIDAGVWGVSAGHILGGSGNGQVLGMITDSYAFGSITQIGSAAWVGAIVGGFGGGYAGLTIQNSYAATAMSGVGSGVAQYVAQYGSVNASFWDTQVSGVATSAAGGTGLTTAQMKSVATYTNAGWNPSYWNFVEGSYPTLKSGLAPIPKLVGCPGGGMAEDIRICPKRVDLDWVENGPNCPN